MTRTTEASNRFPETHLRLEANPSRERPKMISFPFSPGLGKAEMPGRPDGIRSIIAELKTQYAATRRLWAAELDLNVQTMDTLFPWEKFEPQLRLKKTTLPRPSPP